MTPTQALRACALALALSSGALAQGESKDQGDIERIVRTYEAALTAGDVPTIMSLYSAEPVFMPEFAPAAVGRDAVRGAYEWVFRTLKLNGRFHVHEIDVKGAQAWARTSSTGRFTILSTGVEAEVGNSEFFVFTREGGNWKIHRYIFAANKAPGQ
jgi:ketosteroid isomerase-like protein